MPPTPTTAADATRERILDAAEALLRRHGPAKTTVVDVARALGMSHANVYRHFASKAALQDAVAERWLHGVSDPLAVIAGGGGDAAARLEAWVLALAHAKRRKVLDDPELFATYHAVAEAARDVVRAHVTTLRAQVAAIVRDGVARGEFAIPASEADAAAEAVLDATARFHHPHQVRETAGRAEADEARAVRRVVALLVAGLRAGALG
jgi:AcrR family transcriptional regulator